MKSTAETATDFHERYGPDAFAVAASFREDNAARGNVTRVRFWAAVCADLSPSTTQEPTR